MSGEEEGEFHDEIQENRMIDNENQKKKKKKEKEKKRNNAKKIWKQTFGRKK